jgi:hypothetical protein
MTATGSSGLARSRIAAVAFETPSCARNLPDPLGSLLGSYGMLLPRSFGRASGPMPTAGSWDRPAPEAECVEMCRARTRQQARPFNVAGTDLQQVAISKPSDIKRLPVGGHGRVPRKVTPGAYLIVHEGARVYIALHCLANGLICRCALSSASCE